jgi:hypothetical protein
MADDNTPIVPQDYLFGIKVVDIGDIRVARGMTRRPPATCAHRKTVYDPSERRIWCSDCEAEVQSFDAFVMLVQQWHVAHKRLDDRMAKVEESESRSLVSRASKVMDAAWRAHKSVPMCPHCSVAILPEDVTAGVATTSRALVMARRKRDAEKKK